jgi:hypothetical protein
MDADAREAPRTQAIIPVEEARFATKLFLAEALTCRVTRVWLPGLYCPKVAGALRRLGLSLAYYDLDIDLNPVPVPVPASEPSRPEARDLVVGLYPFGLTRSLPERFLTGRKFVLDACHALRTLLNGAGVSGRGPIIVSLRKEFGSAGSAWLVHHEEAKGSADTQAGWPAVRLVAATARGHKATRLAKEALGAKLPSIGASDVLTHLPLLATDRDGAISRLRDQGIDAWYWQCPLPGWSHAQVPQAARLRANLILVPVPHTQVETERLLDRLSSVELHPWRHASIR